LRPKGVRRAFMAGVLGDLRNVVKKHRSALTWTAVAAVLFFIASAAVFARVSGRCFSARVII